MAASEGEWAGFMCFGRGDQRQVLLPPPHTMREAGAAEDASLCMGEAQLLVSNLWLGLP